MSAAPRAGAYRSPRPTPCRRTGRRARRAACGAPTRGPRPVLAEMQRSTQGLVGEEQAKAPVDDVVVVDDQDPAAALPAHRLDSGGPRGARATAARAARRTRPRRRAEAPRRPRGAGPCPPARRRRRRRRWSPRARAPSSVADRDTDLSGRACGRCAAPRPAPTARAARAPPARRRPARLEPARTSGWAIARRSPRRRVTPVSGAWTASGRCSAVRRSARAAWISIAQRSRSSSVRSASRAERQRDAEQALKHALVDLARELDALAQPLGALVLACRDAGPRRQGSRLASISIA